MRTGRPKGSGNRPPVLVVQRIANEEAERHKVDPDTLFAMSRKPRSRAARTIAWLRIMEETQCSMNGLADVWGCDRQAIWRVVR